MMADQTAAICVESMSMCTKVHIMPLFCDATNYNKACKEYCSKDSRESKNKVLQNIGLIANRFLFQHKLSFVLVKWPLIHIQSIWQCIWLFTVQ